MNDPYRITFLTGAGVSTPTGITDFKTLRQTWKYSKTVEETLSLQHFHKNPLDLWLKFEEIFTQSTPKPSIFHRAISELQKDSRISVITQNVDNLHAEAGNANLIELHGNATTAKCVRPSCGTTVKIAEQEPVHKTNTVPKCPKCHKIMKPNITLYDENVSNYKTALDMIVNTQTLIVVGTSLDVSPANQLITLNNYQKIWVNTQPPPKGTIWDKQFIMTADEFIAQNFNIPITLN